MEFILSILHVSFGESALKFGRSSSVLLPSLFSSQFVLCSMYLRWILQGICGSVMIKASDRPSAVVCSEVHHVALGAAARCVRVAHYVRRARDRVAWLETLGIRTAKAITHRHGNGSLLSAAYATVAYALGKPHIQRETCKFHVSIKRAAVQFWCMRKSIHPSSRDLQHLYASKCDASRLFGLNKNWEFWYNGVYNQLHLHRTKWRVRSL